MAIKVYNVKSNARREAKKRGLDPDVVVEVPGGWIIGEPAAASEPEPVSNAEPESAPEPEPAAPKPARTPRKPRAPRDDAKTERAPRQPRAPREDAKRSKLIADLKAGWVSATDLTTRFGWQPHTLRGAISTLAKKLAVKVERQRVEGVTSYRIASPAAE